jgi:hypothetical protein
LGNLSLADNAEGSADQIETSRRRCWWDVSLFSSASDFYRRGCQGRAGVGTTTKVLLALILAASSTLASCASVVAERQKAELDNAYIACLKNETARVDTGVAAPATIAMAIWPACARHFAKIREAVKRETDTTIRNELESRLALRDIDFAIGIVVEVRAEKDAAIR